MERSRYHYGPTQQVSRAAVISLRLMHLAAVNSSGSAVERAGCRRTVKTAWIVFQGQAIFRDDDTVPLLGSHLVRAPGPCDHQEATQCFAPQVWRSSF